MQKPYDLQALEGEERKNGNGTDFAFGIRRMSDMEIIYRGPTKRSLEETLKNLNSSPALRTANA